jgi:hypothetical protein
MKIHFYEPYAQSININYDTDLGMWMHILSCSACHAHFRVKGQGQCDLIQMIFFLENI